MYGTSMVELVTGLATDLYHPGSNHGLATSAECIIFNSASSSPRGGGRFYNRIAYGNIVRKTSVLHFLFIVKSTDNARETPPHTHTQRERERERERETNILS